jgi:hypothetical protein
MRFRSAYLFLFFFVFLLHGCVATQSFPAVARSGDTITLAVGSADGMTKSNTTAQFVSDVDSSVTPLPIRSILRIRPDQTSKAALFNAFLNAEDYYTGHSQWLSIIVIDLPEGLTVGEGHIDIDSMASYGNFPVGINDVPIDIEIIDGVGKRNEFTYNNNFGGVGPGNLADLEPLPQVVLRPPLIQSTVFLAAAEIKVNIPVGAVPDRVIRIVNDDFYTRNYQDQLQMSWSRSGDEFTVNFVSPTGSMEPKQLRFSVVLSPGNDFLSQVAPGVENVTLYDESGERIEIFNGVEDKDFFTIGIE